MFKFVSKIVRLFENVKNKQIINVIKVKISKSVPNPLSKIKIEKKETSKSAAVREVMEECGLINKPQIKSKLLNTYHVYLLNGKSYLKKTSWFLMDYEGSKKFLVQKEEGITSACWVSASGLPIKLKKSYASIAEVLKCVTL